MVFFPYLPLVIDSQCLLRLFMNVFRDKNMEMLLMNFLLFF